MRRNHECLYLDGMHDPTKVRAARELRQLTQAQAARLADISARQWAELERGTPAASALTLALVAHALGTRARDLVKWEDF